MSTTTPAEITTDIEQFCGRIVPGQSPIWVDVTPSASAQLDDCFSNVESLVAAQGGSSLLGWIIWEWPGEVLEAEFHAVWSDEDGRLIDPTPNADGEARLLFLPDRNATDDGGVTASHYHALNERDEVSRYISICQQNSEEQRRAFEQFGGIPLELSQECARRRAEIESTIRQTLMAEQAQRELVDDSLLSEEDASARHSASPSDVEACIALAKRLAARDDYTRAFETLVTTAELNKDLASQVQPTFLLLVESCNDADLVRSNQRRFSSLLF